VVSYLKLINGIFGSCAGTLDHMDGRGEVVLNSINRERGINVEAANVSIVRSSIQDDITTLPVLCAKNLVFTIDRSQKSSIIAQAPRTLPIKIIDSGNQKKCHLRSNSMGTKGPYKILGVRCELTHLSTFMP